MIELDISNSDFIINTNSDIANQWLNDNVGEMIHDDMALSYGHGWKIEFRMSRFTVGKWILTFDDDKYASLFLLRWS
jgi:ketol-acid reductoisomerase